MFISISAFMSTQICVEDGQYVITYKFFAYWVILHAFCCLMIIFQNQLFRKKSFEITRTIRVSNSLEPNQAGCSVGPDLGPNCVQRLSADDTSG